MDWLEFSCQFLRLLTQSLFPRCCLGVWQLLWVCATGLRKFEAEGGRLKAMTAVLLASPGPRLITCQMVITFHRGCKVPACRKWHSVLRVYSTDAERSGSYCKIGSYWKRSRGASAEGAASQITPALALSFIQSASRGLQCPIQNVDAGCASSRVNTCLRHMYQARQTCC